MTEEKMRQIIDAMQGITRNEWLKLRHFIDRAFDSKFNKLANDLTISETDELMNGYGTRWSL